MKHRVVYLQPIIPLFYLCTLLCVRPWCA